MKYDVFIMGDQPTTCPKCGTRTEILIKSLNEISSAPQHHQCLNIKCQYSFLMEDCDNEWLPDDFISLSTD